MKLISNFLSPRMMFHKITAFLLSLGIYPENPITLYFPASTRIKKPRPEFSRGVVSEWLIEK